MTESEPYKCIKADKIDSMERQLKEINTVIHKNSNGDSLLAMSRNTNKAVKDMSSDVRALLTFQTVVETQREMNDERHEKKVRKRQIQIALASLAVGSILTILGMILSMLLKY